MFVSRHIGAGPAPHNDFWYMPVGSGTASGARVSADTALRLSTVFKCVRAIAETVSMLPLPVYRRMDAGKEKAPEHPLARLLRNPNPWQTAMQWREMMQAHAALRGNAYSEIIVNARGQEEMLLPLNPDRMKIEVMPNGLPRYRYTDADKAERILVFGQVLHLQGFAVDGYQGLNPIEAEREAIGSAIATRDFGARYFANDARPSAWIEFAGTFKDEEAKRKWRASWQEQYGGANRGRVAVLEKDMKLHTMSVSNTDAQFIEVRKMQDVDICGLWRVPPHKIGLLDDAKWANIEQQSIEWVSDCIMPWCVRWEQMLLRDLMFDINGAEFFPEHNLAMLLRGDTTSRYTAYGKAIQDGWMTRNEARSLENMNEIDGLDQPLMPLNMAPAGSRGADQARGNQPSNAAQRHIDSRALLVMTAAAERVARKELQVIRKTATTVEAARQLEQHGAFVAQVMALPHAEAAAYTAEVMTGLEAARAMPDADYLAQQVQRLVGTFTASAPAPATTEAAPAGINVAIHLPQGLELSIPTPHIHVPAPIVNVAAAEAPVIHVAAADAPVVNVAAPVVHVAAPFVAVENKMPDEQRMHIVSMPDRVTESAVKRDRDGAVQSTTQTERDA